MLFRRLTPAALAMIAALAAAAVSSPAHAEDAQPDLKTSIAFSEQIGKVGDTVTVTVTVANHGTGNAKDVSVVREWDEGEGALAWTSPALADGAKFDLAAGESKTLTRTGTIPARSPAIGYIQVLYFFAAANKDKNTNDNIAYRSMRVPGQVGDYTIRVVDAKTGDGVAGAVVHFTELSNSPDNASARVTSDAGGNAKLKHTQVGRYDVKVTPPAGWKLGRISAAEIIVAAKPDGSKFELERTGQPTAEPSPPKPTTSPGGAQPGTPASPSSAPTVSPTNSASGAVPGAGAGNGALPVTGSSVTLVAMTGVGLLVAGAATLLFARRRRTRFTGSH